MFTVKYLCLTLPVNRRGAAEVRKQVSSTYFGDSSKNTSSGTVVSASTQNVRIVSFLHLFYAHICYVLLLKIVIKFQYCTFQHMKIGSLYVVTSSKQFRAS